MGQVPAPGCPGGPLGDTAPPVDGGLQPFRPRATVGRQSTLGKCYRMLPNVSKCYSGHPGGNISKHLETFRNTSEGPRGSEGVANTGPGLRDGEPRGTLGDANTGGCRGTGCYKEILPYIKLILKKGTFFTRKCLHDEPAVI